ncbi:MAG TPA: hypothetical protein VIM71_08190, partial [Lacunisphaera sp.]
MHSPAREGGAIKQRAISYHRASFHPISVMIFMSPRAWAQALFFSVGLASSSLAASRWNDVTPDDFKEAAPLIDPDAGAEILIAETNMDESVPNDVRWTHFIRVRIVDER